MNVMNRVTWQTMKKNRVRTIVTVIGIILSTAMFTAVFSLCTSFYNYMREAEVYQSGSYHMYAMHVSGAAARKAGADERVEYTAFARIMGYSAFDSLNPDKPFICLLAADDTFFANMPVKLTEGRLPESGSEVVLPAHLAANGGAVYHIGDTLTLALGERHMTDPDGGDYLLYQENSYSYDKEQLTDVNEKTFTVVGICDRPDFEPFSAPGYTAITLLTEEAEPDTVYECWLRVKNPRRDFFNFTKEHPELSDFGYEEHSGLLMLEGATRYGNIANVLAGFALILSLLVFVGSVALIYSAFSISVSERTKQFGLLSSIGSTKKQIGRSVLFEALTLSAFGIPLGVLAGVGGIALTLYLLRNKFASLIGESGLPMHFFVTWPIIAAAAAVALVTVLASAWIPSLRAMRISPIEAIRQTRDVKAKGRSSKYPKLYQKIFGAEGMLAKKYYTRSRKKYRATIISLVMSIVLFVAASAFCMYITKSVNTVDNRPNFDGYFTTLQRDEFIRLRPALSECASELAGYIATGSEESFYAMLTEGEAAQSYLSYIEATDIKNNSLYCRPTVNKLYMDDAAFRELLGKYGLDEAAFFNADAPAALAVNHASTAVYEYNGNGTFTRKSYDIEFLKQDASSVLAASLPGAPEGYTADFGVYWSGDSWGEGDMLLYCAPEAGSQGYDSVAFDDYGRPVDQLTVKLEFKALPIGGIIREAPVGVPESQSALTLLYPMSVYGGDSDAVDFFFRSEDTQKVIGDMTSILEEAGVPVTNRSFYDAGEDARLMSNIVTIVKVFSYGFITLISLISVANVFNTVTTNVALRRRDYAMLRSMGMTARGMNRMSNYECLIYGTRSLAIGLPIAIGVSYLIFRVANDAAVMRFELPWTAIIIAVVSVFAVVFVSMLYSTGKLKKDNPIDALKDENI